tara:strand:+ start:88 stop:237 length:150 start_codon:yes stop_codon:yes gene_type:complete
MSKEYFIKFKAKEFKDNPNLVEEKLTELRYQEIINATMIKHSGDKNETN